jgi:hypothetical protein
VLSWRLSNTLDGAFCLEALEEALGLFWNCGPVHYVEHLEAPR